MGGEPVYLRCYDLSNGFVKTWSPLILMKKIDGMWHTGVHAFGYEYFYGGGIVKLTAQEVEDCYDMKPVNVDFMGTTQLSQADFERHLISIRDKFHIDYYDLTSWNCNHFSDYILKFLVGRGCPDNIVNMPSQVESTLIGKLVISALKKWSDGEALVHSDDPMHPKAEMLRRGDSLVNELDRVSKKNAEKARKKDQKGIQKSLKREQKMAKKMQKKQMTIEVDSDLNAIAYNRKGERLTILPISPSLRLGSPGNSPKEQKANRLELISGWLGTSPKSGPIMIGSPAGVGRAKDGLPSSATLDKESPFGLSRHPPAALPFNTEYSQSRISPQRPQGILPSPPSARYASTGKSKTVFGPYCPNNKILAVGNQSEDMEYIIVQKKRKRDKLIGLCECGQ